MNLLATSLMTEAHIIIFKFSKDFIATVVQVTGLLDLRDLQAARIVCKQWQLGLSMGVTKLRPRMEANAVGLQWVELHKLQVILLTALRN